MLWGYPLEILDSWGLRLMFGGALIGALALLVSLASAYLLYRVADKAQSELQLKTSAHDVEIETQKSRTAAFERETAIAKLELGRLDADNLAMQTSLRPRRLSFMGWTSDMKKIDSLREELKRFSGTLAFIQVVPDFEARMFANDIASELSAAGWSPRFVTESQSHMSDLRFPEGTAIFTFTDGTLQGNDPGTALWSAITEADVLMSGTGTFGSTPYREILSTHEIPNPGAPYFDPPVPAVFVMVGLKPFTSQFLEIQRRQLERQDTRMDQHLRSIWEKGYDVTQGVPGHPPVQLKPGTDGRMIAVNPEEQRLLPKRTSPTLVLPGGIMLRSSPPEKP